MTGTWSNLVEATNTRRRKGKPKFLPLALFFRLVMTT